jgi:hypothetical protein
MFEGGPLVKSCGKLDLLQAMLRKLFRDSHRVLIFSQVFVMHFTLLFANLSVYVNNLHMCQCVN